MRAGGGRIADVLEHLPSLPAGFTSLAGVGGGGGGEGSWPGGCRWATQHLFWTRVGGRGRDRGIVGLGEAELILA